MKPRTIGIVVFLALAVIAAAGYFGFANSAPQQPVSQAPQTVTANKCDVEQTVEAPGVLENTSGTRVLMPVDGRLAGLMVRAGDAVLAGQVLARPADFASAQAQAEQAVADAQGTLKTAQTKLDGMYYPRASDAIIQNTLARIQLQQRVLAKAQDTYHLVQTRLDKNPAKAQALYDMTNAQVQLDTLVAQYNWYTGKNSTLDVVQAQAARDVARAQLADAQSLLDILNRGITAPFSGVVIEVDAAVGQPLHKNDTLFELIDPKALEVKANVTQEDYPLLRLAQPAQVYFDARPDVISQGKVDRIVPKLVTGDSPTYDIYISLDQVPDGLVDGMTVDTNVTIASRQGVICLPRSVVHASGDNKAVLQVWDGAQAKTRDVTIGLRGDTNVEILTGLQAGEQVVVR